MNGVSRFRISGRAPRSSRRWRGSRWLTLPVIAAVVPLVGGMAVPAAGTGPGGPLAARPAAPAAGQPVPVYAVHGHKAKVPVMRAWHRPSTSWPSAGTATVSLPAPAAGTAAPADAPAGTSAKTATPAKSAGPANAALAGPGSQAVRAGQLPVWVGPGGAARSGSAPTRVRVAVAARSAATSAGIRGVVFTVSGADATATSAAPVHLALDYSSFAYAYGGDYAARLHLVELPACALTTPGVAACRKQTPLPSANDVHATEVGADVTVPASSTASSTGLVVAATSSPSGSAGDFTATPLSEAGQWSSGGASGAFGYSYPVQVPPVPGGLEPTVSLNYDSQAIDGLTSSTNDQASWIGDGWDYSPGFIERDYQSCGVNSGAGSTGDLCWSPSDTVTLSLGGQNTTLVQDSSTGAWHPEGDNGERVRYQTGTTNGTNDGGYWVITEQDGTSYYFGLNQLPGYASGDSATNSAWTVPVYATSSGQPCYNATFANSHCAQAWRWNLDYVTDPHADAIAYFYNTETNYYAPDNGSTATAAYTQAGALSKIEYGLRAGSVYGTTPAAQVSFTLGTARTDVPTDLACSANASCDVISPTFWSRYQLTSISTQALKGSSLGNVDSWALNQTYPSTGDSTSPPSLWLSSVTRTGQDGTSVALPPVTFAGQALPNRIEAPSELGDGYSIITRLRLTTITNETGGVTSVNYLAPSGGCTSGSLPAPDADTLLCYPAYWDPSTGEPPVEDWFNKYVVNEVSEQDTTGNAPPVVTTYHYGGAAWHYDDDSLTRSKQRTWDQWRGFRTVTTETGPATAPDTMTTDTYFQGMNGDYQSGGGPSSVSLSDGHGDTVTDADQYAGMPFEHTVDDGPGGAVVTDAITIPWSSGATGTESQASPLPALQSFMTGVARTRTFTPLAAGGDRESDTANSFDSYGRISSASSVPDTSNASEDTCTTTTYAPNTSTWLLDLSAEVQVVSVPCGTPPALPADAVSDTLSYYDSATSLSADTPSAGDLTERQQATSYGGSTGSTPVYTTESTASYDVYGRPLTSTDADNRKTTTAYTPATGAEPTSVTVTDPMNLTTTTTYDPARDLPLTVKNPAGWTTTEQYDGLGRLTAAWTPGHSSTASAESTYTYKVSNSVPSIVTASTLGPNGTAYLPSETLYDSLGRERETQAETADGNTDVTDIIYNADGWKTLTSNPYYVTGAPTATLVAAPSDEVPSQTAYVYDGDGRVVQQVSYSMATESWETDTAYGGNETTVSYKNVVRGEPTGGTPQTTFTDGRGLTSTIYQYHQGVPANPSDPASDYDATSYTHTPAGQLATIKDAAGDKWSYAYDLQGNQIAQSDPDSGTSSSLYDPAGQLMSVTDARNDQTSYTYDADGRKTGEYDTTGGAAESSGDELASWTWDTLAKGQLTSSTSYYGGESYTEQVLGYYGTGQPTGTETIIPSAEGALAGTYIQEDAYNSFTGQPTTMTDSAAGGLPQEKYGYGYNNAGQPISLSGNWSYVQTLSYTELGQPLEYKMNSDSEPVYMADTYDEQTNLLTEQETQTGTSPVTVDDQHYQYDNVGNVLSEADTPASGATQAQCFQYDYLGRLSQAWSQGSSNCSSGPSQPAEAGAAAPYGDQYNYNAVGNMTTDVSTPASGAATTTTDSYPAAGSAQPHAVSSQQVSGPSGASSTEYAYNPDGELTSTTGSSTPGESLSWDDTGRLSSVTSSAGTTSYLYDADGNLLLEQDPGRETLFLDDEELALNISTNTVTGTRFYSIDGQLAATRTGSSTVDLMVPDREGTSLLAIDSQTLALTQRYYDPYGNPIGTTPSTWPGEQGYVGGTADPATGLTNMNAREYQPGTGSFISPDPLLNPDEPQDLNSYAYAADNPSTDSDPSGQCMESWCPPPPAHGSNPSPANYGPGTSNGDSCQDWLPGCPGFTGGGAGQGGETLYGPGYYTSPVPVSSRSASNSSARTARTVYHAPPPKPVVPHVSCGIRGMGCLANEVRNASAGSWQENIELFGLFGLSVVNLLQAGADPVTDGLEGADIGALAADGADDAAEDADAGATCGGQSFTAATKVLLASGAAVPIASLKPGDKVLATSTKTGKTSAEPVTAVLVHHDTDLYDLTVKTTHGSATIQTTSGHLFWDQDARQWVKAGALKQGTHLRTANGSAATVLGGYAPATADGWMWDLSVPGGNDHDFYIDITVATVLAHNCPAGPQSPKEYIEPTNPPQNPPSADKVPSGWIVRVMGPTEDYPNGYWRLSNADGHYVDPSTMKQPGNVSKALFRAMTHVPLPANGG